MIRLEALTISDNPPDFAEATGEIPATSLIHVEAPPVSADVSPPTYERRRSTQVVAAAPAPVPTSPVSAYVALPSYEARGSPLADAHAPPVPEDAALPTYETGGYVGSQGNRLFGGS